MIIEQKAHTKNRSKVWVTEKIRGWESRDLKRQEQLAIAQGQYANNERDLSPHLDNWAPIQALRGKMHSYACVERYLAG